MRAALLTLGGEETDVAATDLRARTLADCLDALLL